MMTIQHFTATITRSGEKTILLIPFNPNDVWGVKQRHYITGSVNGSKLRGPIENDGNQFYLALGPVWCRDNGMEAGVIAEVSLSPEGPQFDLLDADILNALEAEPQARIFFESLATFYRKNYIKWIVSARRPETRAARILEMIALLKAGKKQK
jgi:hypothetical protein